MEKHTYRPEQSGHLYFNNSPDALAVLMDARSAAFVTRARQASSAAKEMVDYIDRVLPSNSDAPPAPEPPRAEHNKEIEESTPVTQLPARRRLADIAIFVANLEETVDLEPDKEAA